MQKMPMRLGRACLVLEVDMDKELPAQWMRITCSRPGREGTVTRTWALNKGLLDHRSLEDMHVWVMDCLLGAATVMVGGAQVTFEV